jgi:hypothetical protein
MKINMFLRPYACWYGIMEVAEVGTDLTIQPRSSTLQIHQEV